MFKEFVQCVHTTARDFCFMRPALVARGASCRPVIKNCFCSNIIFFVAIFMPLYVCLIGDVAGLLRSFNRKITGRK